VWRAALALSRQPRRTQGRGTAWVPLTAAANLLALVAGSRATLGVSRRKAAKLPPAQRGPRSRRQASAAVSHDRCCGDPCTERPLLRPSPAPRSKEFIESEHRDRSSLKPSVLQRARQHAERRHKTATRKPE